LNELQQPNLHIALVHHPVVDKNGATIASAVTNLDLHDIARVAKTYAVKTFYVVTPLSDQKVLVERIVDHWLKGAGSRYNPKRRQALELIKIKESFEDVIEDIHIQSGLQPKTVVTSARKLRNIISYTHLRHQLMSGIPYLLIFGTAWGLANEIIMKADHCLAPISGLGDYNHLSVRCAAAITMDRLLFQR
jgi:hypothetical protein